MTTETGQDKENLKAALFQDGCGNYEAIRIGMIDRLGYDRFREIQNSIFNETFGHKPTNSTPPPITPLEFTEADHDKAQKLADALGYEQTAYTSTSALWGLFCLPENPEHACNKGKPTRGGTIIKTRELGMIFVQLAEEIYNQ